MRTRSKRAHRCIHCGQTFALAKTLKIHMHRAHPAAFHMSRLSCAGPCASTCSLFLAASVAPYLPLRLVDRQARMRRVSGDNGHTRLLWYGDSAARTRHSRTQRKQVGCDTVHHVFPEVRERGRSYQARGSETCCGALCETHRSLVITSTSRQPPQQIHMYNVPSAIRESTVASLPPATGPCGAAVTLWRPLCLISHADVHIWYGLRALTY